MSRQLLEVEAIMQQLITEHQKLLRQMESQQAAMKSFDVKSIDNLTRLQETTRLRIAGLESKRRLMTQQLGRILKVKGDLTITRLGELYPSRKQFLFSLRDELKDVIQQISQKTHIAGKLAGAVMGHLNTVVRLLAGAVEQAGIYTKAGVPQVSARIGVMEAVG
jgi:hypothetical protein